MIARSSMIALVLAGAAASVGLSGCGKTGALEQPAPLFGAQAKADFEAKKRHEAEDRAAAAAARRANQVVTPDDAAAQPLPQAPYAQPLPGRTDPFSHGPQGATPGPGNGPDQ